VDAIFDGEPVMLQAKGHYFEGYHEEPAVAITA
jgi:hypothetical protein